MIGGPAGWGMGQHWDEEDGKAEERSRAHREEVGDGGEVLRDRMRNEEGERRAGGGGRRSKVFGLRSTLAGLTLVAIWACLGFTGSVEAYLLQATMYWERVGVTPQFLLRDLATVYNGPCGKFSYEYSKNQFCGDLERGITLTPLNLDARYPRRYLMRLTVTMVINKNKWTGLLPLNRGEKISSLGLWCRDIAQSQTTGNCPSNLDDDRKFLVVDTASDGNVLQFSELFDYQSDVGNIIFASANVTFGFNYTAERYPRCSAVTGTPTCYCATAACDQTSENLVALETWTLNSTMTFDSTATTFVGGVTPLTNHHSPRIGLPPIIYVPHMLPTENVSFPLTAVDEDGATVVQWTSGRGVVSVSSNGIATVTPLFLRDSNGFASKSEGWKHHLFKARITAVDPVLSNARLTSPMEFYVKSCPLGGPVPINNRWDGSGLTSTNGGFSTPRFVTLGLGRCTESNGVAVTPAVFDKIKCFGPGKVWEDVWVTAPQTTFVCTVGERCEANVTAVQLNFETTKECSWSGYAGGTRCSSLLTLTTGVLMDFSTATQTGEHAAFADKPGFSSTAVTRFFPFMGRSENIYNQSLPYHGDIGRKEMFCATARSNSTVNGDLVSACWSTPHCVTVEVLGRRPSTVSPAVSAVCPDRIRGDFSQYLTGACPDVYLCMGSDTTSEISIEAVDVDYGETVNVKIDSLTNLGENLGDAVNGYSSSLINASKLTYPLNNPLVNSYCAQRTVDPTAPVAQIPSVAALSTVQCGSGLMKVNVNLAISATKSPVKALTDSLGYKYAEFGEDKVLCYTISDNQQAVWGKGLNNYFSRCHIVRLRGPPVFIGNPTMPLDSPFAGFAANGLGSGESTIQAVLGLPINFTMRARDPNFEDNIQVLFLQDPGVPLDGTVTDQVCVDHGTRSNTLTNGIYKTYRNCTGQGASVFCPTLSSPCSEAYRTVNWTPQPGSEGKTFRVCAVAKDDNGFCSTKFYRRDPACPYASDGTSCSLAPILGASVRATPDGYYNNPMCVNIFVAPPQPYWLNTTVPTEGTPVQKLGHVGCEIRYTVAAADPAYRVAIIVSPTTRLPLGASIFTISTQGVGGANESNVQFRWTPGRGMEGSTHLVCFEAFPFVTFKSNLSPEFQESRVGLDLPMRCVSIFVRRCKYCAGQDDTLLTKMKELSEDMNWLRLWAANGNDDGDPLTQLVEDPGLLSTGLFDGVQNGQILNVGPVYRLLPGETLYSVAGRFRTTVKSLLNLNPDITSEENVKSMQDVCMIPCTY